MVTLGVVVYPVPPEAILNILNSRGFSLFNDNKLDVNFYCLQNEIWDRDLDYFKSLKLIFIKLMSEVISSKEATSINSFLVIKLTILNDAK